MKEMRHALRPLTLLLLLALLVLTGGCREGEPEGEVTPIVPTATSVSVPETVTPAPEDPSFLTIATDAPFPPFSTFDEFGTVTGFDAELAESILSRTGYRYEFVVTNFDGMLESVADGEFDMAMSALARQEPVPGVSYTNPYLEVGQVLVVLANEDTITGFNNIPPGVPIGVLADSVEGQRAASRIAGIPDSDLQYYESVGAALQALIEGQVVGVILDHENAEHYTRTHYEQMKIAGGSGRAAWITDESYVIAVDSDRPELLEDINEAIAESQSDGTIDRVIRNWLVSTETIDAGESLIGTPPEIIVIGVVGALENVDPAAPPDVVGWEVKANTMSGLYMFDPEDNLVPVLASEAPVISEDGLEYTFSLRSGLTFPDGSALTADDVKWSINRAATLGSWHVNAFLADSNGDFIADADAVEVLSPTTVRFTLKEPTSFFLNLLATPPYYVVSEECYANTADAARSCNGVGPYEIIEWQGGELVQLQANPQWPGETEPAFEDIQLRFYETAEGLRNAVELGAVDIAWTGLPEQVQDEVATLPDVRTWEGPPTFKSYLVFQQEDTPFATPSLRQAIAYAVDREELAAISGGRRRPLYSPLPDNVPAHIPAEPERNLERAQELLRLSGYSANSKLTIPLWYLNDGRYTAREEEYALALERQLEETGMIEVELNGAAWGTYSAQMANCEYTTFLLGWPPVGWPTRYPAAMGWLEYFVTNTDSLCSNYESAAMDSLIDQVRRLAPTDVEEQQVLYEQIQELWAQEYPTVDLMQAAPRALSRDSIGNLQFSRMGLLHYALLTKEVSTGEN